jgi:hypothetical protein
MRAMAAEEDDDLYDEEFDFVDDDEEEAEGNEGAVAEDAGVEEDLGEDARGDEGEEEPLDEYGRPETTPANYVVHIYEHKKFTRTIDRPFTPEDAEAFATEFNRTSKNYGRMAVSGKNDAKPKKALD